MDPKKQNGNGITWKAVATASLAILWTIIFTLSCVTLNKVWDLSEEVAGIKTDVAIIKDRLHIAPSSGESGTNQLATNEH